MPHDLGATARLTAECRDPGGALTTAATVTVTVTLPDGTTALPEASETDTGIYQADYPTVAPGRHSVRWVWTGPAAAYTDMFDVREESPSAILSLADARHQVKARSPQDDDDLRFWIGATTRSVEYFVGPVVVRTVTELHSVRRVRALALRQVPALTLISVTAVLSGGTSYQVSELDLDPSTGIVRPPSGGDLYGPLRVTYKAGRRTVDESITAAARIILQHLWRTRLVQGRGGLAGGGDDFSVTEPIPGLGYAVPNRAVQLLNPDQIPPGMA
ncbi:hypothetical protein AB0P17_36645 [Streptomyces sp. NPDC088124]|uniref:hypothetical protein n=1 Tax=Streptomyces sp. NPDC088124 TaxID=3154654 RepID=UPI00343886CA